MARALAPAECMRCFPEPLAAHWRQISAPAWVASSPLPRLSPSRRVGQGHWGLPTHPPATAHGLHVSSLPETKTCYSLSSRAHVDSDLMFQSIHSEINQVSKICIGVYFDPNNMPLSDPWGELQDFWLQASCTSALFVSQGRLSSASHRSHHGPQCPFGNCGLRSLPAQQPLQH